MSVLKLIKSSRPYIAGCLISLSLNVVAENYENKSADSVNTPVDFAYGNDIWLPGWTFNNGDDWLGLACDSKGCSLVPARLKVMAASYQENSDDRNIAGQTLSFSTQSSIKNNVILWFSNNTKLPWLKAGSTPTYYAENITPTSNNNDSFEIVLQHNSITERLMPVLLADNLASTVRQDELPTIYLQLRSSGKRQLIEKPMLTSCSGEPNPDYLIWAGDLDADGRTDYVLKLIQNTGAVVLYLSSRASKEESITGYAGQALAKVFQDECY